MFDAYRSGAHAQKRSSDTRFAQRDAVGAAGELAGLVRRIEEIVACGQDAHGRRGMGQEITTRWLGHGEFSVRESKKDDSPKHCNAQHGREPGGVLAQFGLSGQTKRPTNSRRCPVISKPCWRSIFTNCGSSLSSKVGS